MQMHYRNFYKPRLMLPRYMLASVENMTRGVLPGAVDVYQSLDITSQQPRSETSGFSPIASSSSFDITQLHIRCIPYYHGLGVRIFIDSRNS